MESESRYSDGEDLSDSEMLEISTDFLKFKSVEVLKQLIDILPFNLQDDKQRTLLHYAAESGHFKKVKFLVESGLVDPNIRDSDNMNSLEIASKKGFTHIIDYLIEKGLQCEIPIDSQRLNKELDPDIEGQIAAAIYADNAMELEIKLARYVRNINGFFSLPEFYSWTMVNLSGAQLSPKCLNYLLNHGADWEKESLDDGYNCLDNILNSLICIMPPETEEEWINASSGVECILSIISRVLDMNPYLFRISKLIKQASLLGKGSSEALTSFEIDIEKKVDHMRLVLSNLLNNAHHL